MGETGESRIESPTSPSSPVIVSSIELVVGLDGMKRRSGVLDAEGRDKRM